MMRNSKYIGLTLIEILMAIAIVAVLSAGLYMVGSRVETQAKIKQTQSAIEMLSTALEQYRDANSCFPFKAGLTYDRTKLESITDCNGLDGKVSDNAGNLLPAAGYNDLYASSEALYYFLNRNPASKKIIGTINSSLITDKDNKNTEYFFKFTGDPVVYPLPHFVDAWNYPFRYTYKAGDNFPLIESAGPDKDFNKKDDNITSR
jgi:prepilin-type N-terminal cleavage/methylation domain-containing protein